MFQKSKKKTFIFYPINWGRELLKLSGFLCHSCLMYDIKAWTAGRPEQYLHSFTSMHNIGWGRAEFFLTLVVEVSWFSSQKVVGFQCSPSLVIRCHWYSVLVFSCAALIKTFLVSLNLLMMSWALYDKIVAFVSVLKLLALMLVQLLTNWWNLPFHRSFLGWMCCRYQIKHKGNEY